MTLDIIESSSLIIDVDELRSLSEVAFKMLKHVFTYKNPKYIENEKWGYSNYETPKHLFSYEIHDGKMYISRGGLAAVERELFKFKIETNVIDRTLVCEPVDFSQSNVTRRDDQQTFIEELRRYTTGCGVAYTSFGKTLTMLELAAEIKQPTLILVHTTFLQEQWIKEATEQKLFNLDLEDIGGVGGVFGTAKNFKEVFGKDKKHEKRRYRKLNICLYHSLSNPEHLEFFKDRIGLVLFDEGQKSPIEGVQQVVNHFRARYRYTVSAQLKRKDGKEFLTFDTFGPVRTRARETNSDSKIQCNIQLVLTKYDDLHYDDDQNYSAMITRMAKDHPRNILICKRVIKRIKRGDLCIIFVERKEHAGILAKMLSKFRVQLLTGPINKDDIESIKIKSVRKILKDYDNTKAYDTITKLAEKKELDVIIGTQKAEVGLSIRTLNYGIATTPMNNEERFTQIRGRIERTYSSEQVKYFGHKKPTPLLEVLYDKNLSPSSSGAEKIKEKYSKRVRVIKPKD